MLCHPDWGALDEYDRRRLLGLTGGEDWGLFGNMRRAALNAVFGANREAIQNIVLAVVAANDDAFPQLAFESYSDLLDFNGVGAGIASRLLTLARSDRFVSVNRGSRDGLAEFFGFARTTLGNRTNYPRLLVTIYEQDWYENPAPANAREQAISRIRAALLDSFVYTARGNAG